MNKNSIIKKLVIAANMYNNNLMNKHFLIAYGKINDIKYIEITLNDSNFLYLTGIKTHISPSLFFKRLLKNRIGEKDIEIKQDGTTAMKLDVIEEVLDFRNIAKIIGDYNFNKPKLITEKIIGNIRASIGFIKIKSGYYVPNTVIKNDVRDYIKNSEQVIFILSKEKSEKSYTNIIKQCKNKEKVSVAINKLSKIFDISI